MKVVSHLLVFFPLVVFMASDMEAIQVIGGHRTVLEGQDVDLSCQMVDTQEQLTQVTWQRRSREYPTNENFYIISPDDGPKRIPNGNGAVFEFIGSVADNNGSIRLKRARYLDEGIYTCIFTVFPSGPFNTEITLTVLVPPSTSVIDIDPPVVGPTEVTMATCIAANAKPAAEIKWITGTLGSLVRSITNSTQHKNETTTVVSHIVGMPTRDANQQLVECVVTQSAQEKDTILPYRLNISYPPLSVNISETADENLVWICTADSNPTARYNWHRGDKPWPAAAVREGERLVLTQNSALNGLYICQASNLYGTSTASLHFVFQTSGSCTVCWSLWGLTLCLIAAAVLLIWYWKTHGTPSWFPHSNRRAPARHEEEEEVEEPL